MARSTTNESQQAAANTSSPPVRDVVKALEWLAQNSLREGRLTSPPADNAYYYFSRLLAISPDNESVGRGFVSIAEQYVVLAEQSFSKGDHRQARTYIALGRQIDPANKGLAALETFINTRELTVWDRLFGLVTGSSQR